MGVFSSIRVPMSLSPPVPRTQPADSPSEEALEQQLPAWAPAQTQSALSTQAGSWMPRDVLEVKGSHTHYRSQITPWGSLGDCWLR